MSHWLVAYDKADEGSAGEQRAVAAIHGMGTNAIPYLTRWIAAGDYGLQMAAPNAFKLLGPEAAMAVPDLALLLVSTNELVSTLAGTALGNIGVPALPVLMAGLTNRQFRVVTGAGSALVELGTNAKPAIPILLTQLEHPNRYYRQHAADVLGQLSIEAEQVVPALTRLLRDNHKPVRFTALSGLEQFGSQARPSIPAISRLLVDLDEDVRKAATNALRKIAPDRPPKYNY